MIELTKAEAVELLDDFFPDLDAEERKATLKMWDKKGHIKEPDYLAELSSVLDDLAFNDYIHDEIQIRKDHVYSIFKSLIEQRDKEAI